MAFSQNDPAWKNTRLGISVSAGDTIGNYGCYVTAIANVCEWAGHSIDPVQINDICKQNGWFIESTPGDRDIIARDDIPALLCSNLGYTGRHNWTGAVDINFFDDASDPNVAYIIKIDASPAKGLQSHFTFVWAKPDATDLTIDDSWDGVRKALSHYGDPSKIIYSAMRFVKVALPVIVTVHVPPVVETPPAAPAPYVPPTAPLQAPSPEKYSLVVTSLYFDSAEDAVLRRHAVSTIAEGIYYVIDKKDEAYNLSKNYPKDNNQWVNTIDNVVQPPTSQLDPPDMEAQLPPAESIPDEIEESPPNWHSTLDLRYAGMYVFLRHDRKTNPSATTVPIVDLETGQQLLKDNKPLAPSNGQYSQFSGKVQWTDGNWYGRLKDTTSEFKWYGSLIEDLEPYADVYGTKTTLQEREVLHTLTKLDRLNKGIAKIQTIGRNIWDIIAPKEKK